MIDGATLNTQTVAAGYEPFWMAVNPVTNTIYVANNCADSSCSTPPTITAITGPPLPPPQYRFVVLAKILGTWKSTR